MIARYVDLKPECELQVLYTLQAYVSHLEHPAGKFKIISVKDSQI